jgi:hypothetical protein
MATNVLGKVYDTLMCSPGMNEAVKIDAKISRKTVLLLNNVIEHQAKNAGAETGPGQYLPADALDELKTFAEDCLKKAGLAELYAKIAEIAEK